MISFRGQKKLELRPDRSDRASSPFSYAESPPHPPAGLSRQIPGGIVHHSIVILSIIFTAFLQNKTLQALSKFLAVFAAQKDDL